MPVPWQYWCWCHAGAVLVPVLVPVAWQYWCRCRCHAGAMPVPVLVPVLWRYWCRGGDAVPLRLLPRNGCSCEAEPGLALPLPGPLFGQGRSVDFGSAFAPEELPRVQGQREREYRSHRLR